MWFAEVIGATTRYVAAWTAYETRTRRPDDDRGYDTWVDSGPKADDIEMGLADVLVMSSGEIASLRLARHLRLDGRRRTVRDRARAQPGHGGRRLLDDWCLAVCAH